MSKFKNITQNQKNLEAVGVPFSGNGWNTITGSTLKFTAAQRLPNNGRAFSNLYSSFGLPLTSGQTSSYDGAWLNTGLSGFTQPEVLVIDIPNNEYGELIDGRTIKLTLPMKTGGTMEFFSSYYTPESFSSDNSDRARVFGHSRNTNYSNANPLLPSTNVAFLFADGVRTPSVASSNTNITSWADGWTENIIPNGYAGSGADNFRFSNVITTGNQPKAAAEDPDLPVGICYLDKGFIVITDTTILNQFSWSAGTMTGGTNLNTGSPTYYLSGITNMYFTGNSTTVPGPGYYGAPSYAACSFYSFEKQYVLSVNIVADSNEFFATENQTASSSNSPHYGAGGTDTGIDIMSPGGYMVPVWDLSNVSDSYITEVGLYDRNNRLLAVAKPDRPIKKPKTGPVALTLKLQF